MNFTKPVFSSRRILVVGLGNPSPTYNGTRHNVGNWLIDQLVKHRWNGFLALKPDKSVGGFKTCSSMKSEASHMILAASTGNFMNILGQPIKKLWHKFQKESVNGLNLLIVHDELELPLGKVQLRKGTTSARGHNGLKSIKASIGDGYMKLGIGIGKPPKSGDGAISDYVLSKFTHMEAAKLEDATLEQAANIMDEILKGKHFDT